MISKIKCPFCLKQGVEAELGKTICPESSAEFKIDDRLECIFADISKMRLSGNGFVCRVCGLVRGDEVRFCLYCGARLSTNLQ